LRRIKGLFAATSMRLALVQAAIVAIAFTAAGFSATAIVHRDLAQARAGRVRAEMTSLLQERMAEGEAGFVDDVRRRADAETGWYYRVTLASGVRPVDAFAGARLAPGWTTLDWDGADEPASHPHQDIDVLTTAVPGGGFLSIGAAHDVEEQLRNSLVRDITIAGGVAALAALVTSAIVTLGTLRRVHRLAALAEGAARGELARRAPVRTDGGDDIDVLARSLNRMLDDIGVLVEDLRGVGAAIAHDIRTPLSRLAQSLARLESGPLEPAQSTRVAQAREDLEEALRLIASTLRLAEIQSNLDAPLSPIDLEEIAARIADAYKPDLEDGGRALHVRLAPAPTTGDGGLVSQALANLIENAIAHTPVGAQVTLMTGMRDGRAFMAVSDDGPGIPPDKRAAALRGFSRLEPSRSRAGFGLGLAIVAAIARRHRADLNLFDAGPGLGVSLSFDARGAV